MSLWSSVQRDVHFEYYGPAESEIDDEQRLPQGEATLRNHVLVFSVGSSGCYLSLHHLVQISSLWLLPKNKMATVVMLNVSPTMSW